MNELEKEKKRLLRIKRFLKQEERKRDKNGCWDLNPIPENRKIESRSCFEGTRINPTQDTLDVMRGKYR